MKYIIQNEAVQVMGCDIKSQCQETNNLLASGGIGYAFRTHYVDTQTGIAGIESLIESILTNNLAINAKGAELSAMRSIAISQSMFVSEIIAEVRQAFGADRYPDKTVYQWLSVNMTRKGIVGKIKLSKAEDANRTSDKPRCKYYLILKTETI